MNYTTNPSLGQCFCVHKNNYCMLEAALGAAADLVISWLIKEVADLISGECPYGFTTLLIVAGGAFALLGLGWILDRT